MKKILVLFVITSLLNSCAYDSRRNSQETPFEILRTNLDGTGFALQVVFAKGRHHNHPLMAIWAEDMDGNYLQTLYVSESIAKGYFKHGDSKSGRWDAGPLRRPAALPYWAHKRGVREADGLFIPTQETAIPDAFTGATPKSNFILETKTNERYANQFRVLLEINQSWDWNTYWHNNKFPYNNDYKSSSQPAVVYEAIVDIQAVEKVFEMRLIGHSHYAGKTGELFTDISTLTTALEIAYNIKVVLKD